MSGTATSPSSATGHRSQPTGHSGPTVAAVLFDMDGTLLDSEKIWDVALHELAASLGGVLTAEARTSMVGANLRHSVGIVHADVGAMDADERASADFLVRRTGELFATDLVFKPGALELLERLHAAAVPTALVTSTVRSLTETCLQFLGRQYFAVSVCGDEVEVPKPGAESYAKAARLLGVAAGDCVAIEDSPTGIASAEAAGCAVLAVPSEVPIAEASTRTVRASLVGVDLSVLGAVLRDRR